jgi:hypothetical protein
MELLKYINNKIILNIKDIQNKRIAIGTNSEEEYYRFAYKLKEYGRQIHSRYKEQRYMSLYYSNWSIAYEDKNFYEERNFKIYMYSDIVIDWGE